VELNCGVYGLLGAFRVTPSLLTPDGISSICIDKIGAIDCPQLSGARDLFVWQQRTPPEKSIKTFLSAAAVGVRCLNE
jgi:hypothetical protein